MATLITKNSSTASAVPLAADLTQGELAVNVTDKKLYTKNSGGSVVQVGGDVVGPASSTDNAFTRFDSTTGKLLQNSTGATLSDTGAAVFTGSVDIAGNSTAGSNIKLYEDTDNGTNYVAFKAPDTIAANVTWTLPATDGSSAQVLSTNGSGTLSWATASGGGASAATPTALGTVYGSQTSGSGSPYLTAYGYWAANSNTGAGNTALGWAGLYVNTSGADNTSVGMQSMVANTTGSSNVAVGKQALQANTTGGSNTAVGYQAAYSNTAASSSVAVGWKALFSNTVGSSSTAVGNEAGYSANITSGESYNSFFGFRAGYNVTTGLAHTCLGYGSGGVQATGSRGVYIGFNNNASSSSVGDEIVISTYSGTTGKGANTGFISPNGGAVYQGNNSSSWSTTSDQRLKKNIVDNTVGLSAINSIRVRNFEYRIESEITELPTHCAIKKEGVQLGVIAQELQAVLPDCVKTESTGVLSVDTDNLTWYLINAVKELKAEIDRLKGNV